MDDSQVLEPTTEPVVENPKSEEVIEQEDEIKVEGKDIVVNGEKYDPERALELIKKLRPFETKATKLEKKLALIDEAEQKRKEADLSEKEKAELRAEKAEKKLAELTLKEQRREAAKEAELPEAFIDRIKGETLEEMIQDAKKMVEALPPAQKQKSSIGVTNPGQNAQGLKETDLERARRLGLTR